MKLILIEQKFYNLLHFYKIEVRIDEGDILLDITGYKGSTITFKIVTKKLIELKKLHIITLRQSIENTFKHLFQDKDRGLLDVDDAVCHEIEDNRNKDI